MANRLMCEVLEEMRTLYKTRNFSPLLGLIEEAQILGNRMEASIRDKHDIEYYQKERRRLKNEVKALKETLHELEMRAMEAADGDGKA